MAKITPFRALRSRPELAAQIASVPYDVVSREEARSLAAGNSKSFLHISRAEIDLPEISNPYSPEVYAKAKFNLEAMIQAGSLITEPDPGLYIYRLEQDGHIQTGVAGTFSIDEYERGLIARHERTRQEKEDDRTRHVLTLKAQTGPVFLAYRDRGGLDALVAKEVSSLPLFQFTAEDGVKHTLWRAVDTSALVREFAEVTKLYIADGHHRAASAARAYKELPGVAAAAQMFAVAFPASQLRILPYHRIIRDMGGLGETALLERISRIMRITQNASPAPARGCFSLYVGGRWYELKPRSTPSLSAIDALDVSVLQNEILGPVFGIQDPRTDPRIDFVGGSRGTDELERRVQTGQAACAFSMHATTLDDLFKIADADQIMPPKSTWFEPKLRDGLLSHWIGEPFRA